MEYVQEGIATLHDFGDASPAAPTDSATVVVPMTEREHAGLAAERVLSALEVVSPERVVVPLRASADRVEAVVEWLDGVDLPLSILWCDGPRLSELLSNADLNGTRGKGRDVWLALGVASDSEYVVVHDADAKSYDARHVPKLLFPLAHGKAFSKGYYARIENDRLYGRLFRLFYRPLIEAIRAERDAPVLEYLGAFRYALAGEFATTGRLARRLRIQRGWGLEVGTLGEAFRLVGADGSAQVDLGVHEHDHRAVSGPSGLTDMARQVGQTLFQALDENGVEPTYETLERRYRVAAERIVESYALDAVFNEFEYDQRDELAQIDAYADVIDSPGSDARLPAWDAAPIEPEAVASAALEDLSDVMDVDRRERRRPT
ncbi:MAG: glycosyl transferase family 2 [Natronomonas sp.]|jgi:glucosyl-3-phosphoglycerate synthase|uniref:Glycosyl transferase family 2 n=1 Tax=Natronomonas salsuginis TaxID=2217661 RepID=A0A4U5JAX9_9EURY|nr:MULTISPECIES: glycosyl transferase family 2 [Natronomonas]MDR9380126.1 glycosyl transferase family 2 [Natronomonas sp.]MDR9429599.1 glycosyl transferase family 2 [Natronomonas sp.]TKR26352.1 glycosyl transferase family 2 [Natronomonas salsuginis]